MRLVDPIQFLSWTAIIGVVVLVALLVVAYRQEREDRADLPSCMIAEPHPWHDGCWQARPTPNEERPA